MGYEEHDAECELIKFGSAMTSQMLMVLSPEEWKFVLYHAKHGVRMCWCQHRRHKATPPTAIQFDAMWQTFVRFVQDYKLGHKVGTLGRTLGELANAMEGKPDGRVIQVDFRNRRRR